MQRKVIHIVVTMIIGHLRGIALALCGAVEVDGIGVPKQICRLPVRPFDGMAAHSRASGLAGGGRAVARVRAVLAAQRTIGGVHKLPKERTEARTEARSRGASTLTCEVSDRHHLIQLHRVGCGGLAMFLCCTLVCAYTVIQCTATEERKGAGRAGAARRRAHRMARMAWAAPGIEV
jgi:hypothetical protein